VLPESMSSGVMLLLSVTGLEMDRTPRAAGSWDARRYAKLC
jgi:hypothetical protein